MSLGSQLSSVKEINSVIFFKIQNCGFVFLQINGGNLVD